MCSIHFIKSLLLFFPHRIDLTTTCSELRARCKRDAILLCCPSQEYIWRSTQPRHNHSFIRSKGSDASLGFRRVQRDLHWHLHRLHRLVGQVAHRLRHSSMSAKLECNHVASTHLLLGTTTQLLSQAKAEKPLLLGPHPCSLVLGCRAWFSTGTLALMCLRTEILINTRRARGKSPLNPVASAVHIFDVSITSITCMHLSHVLDVGRLVSHL